MYGEITIRINCGKFNSPLRNLVIDGSACFAVQIDWLELGHFPSSLHYANLIG